MWTERFREPRGCAGRSSAGPVFGQQGTRSGPAVAEHAGTVQGRACCAGAVPNGRRRGGDLAVALCWDPGV